MKVLVVFESNFNRAMWVFGRLKEVTEREREQEVEAGKV